MKVNSSKFNNNFKGKSFISINQLTRASEIKKIFRVADQMKKIVIKKKPSKMLRGFCIAELFYQPSTRTFTSFLAAAKWLGAITIPIHGMSAYSSAVKGESIEDTVKSIYQTTASDLIIIRHPADNSSERAAEASFIPIINAGAGKKEHPTQAVLDLYTIKDELERMKNLKVVFLGDLKYGRTIKSLGKLLSLVDKNLQLFLVSPKILKMPRDLVKEWKAKGVKVYETDNLLKVLPEADVLYATRIQKEWFEAEGKLSLYRKLKGAYNITLKTLEKAKKKMIIMHPLPRVGEIAYEVDDDPRAVYFKQMRNGLYTRMALLKLILVGK
ncbi:aspartate carbamoyltransferase [Candidatus Microgenomates bacterium]|nr:aspartate carbamoyltransferase [Candidatus Microgenomates bacterium]